MVCHSLLQWTTFFQNSPSWPICLGWANAAWLSFIELDKAVLLVIKLARFLWLWFSVSALWCPLTTPTILLGFLLPWTWGVSSWLLQQSTATALSLGQVVSPHSHPSWPWSSSCWPSHIVNLPQKWYIYSIDELRSTYHYHPKSRVYIRLHSLWCTTYGLKNIQWHVSIIIVPPRWFHCSKCPLCFTYWSLTTLESLATTEHITVSRGFGFFQNVL